MIPSGSVRYEKLPNTEETGDEDAGGSGEEEEDQVTVFLYSPSGSFHKRNPRRELWLRVAVAAVLLAVSLGFVVCEWYGCLSADASLEGGLQNHHHDGHALDSQSHKETEDRDHQGKSGHRSHEHPSSQYHHGVVITDSTVCSEAGREVLEDGGNVVDAGMAALLCLGVVHPHAAGVGGVFSGILYNRTTGISRGIRTTCTGSPLITYGVPATLQGIRRLHSLYGRSNWEKLFVKAIKLAKEGFHIDDTLALALKSNELRICQSALRDLFCDRNGSVKAPGSIVTNRKLSELLQSAGANDSLLPESLGMKLAVDLPSAAQQAFVKNIQRCGVEIREPFTIEEEGYSVFTASSELFSSIISETVKRHSAQNASFWGDASDYTNVSIYVSLFNTAKLVYNNFLGNQSLGGLPVSNMVSSHIGVLDNSGNILIVSTSLNSSFGAAQVLPSTGVLLSDFVLDPAADLAQWSCASIVKLRQTDKEDDDDSEDALGVGVTGGFSAPFIAAQIIINRLILGKSISEAVISPLLHVEMVSPESLSACISVVSNTSDTYKLLMEGEGQMHTQAADECADKTVAFIMQKHAGHVGAYGVPAAKACTDGF
ncbi:glutathione hydrolase 6 [Scleropages formosus]|uniref:glutathione hydrolase 6 n=1 Tax=Scleropages formosus TaxID=113540 RepID=UPI0010FA6EF7|nr:glutathione hydrolase 6 [Scleropages formosus]